jgi:hypothetical protein
MRTSPCLRNALCLLALVIVTSAVRAQSPVTVADSTPIQKNIVKLNVAALFVKNFSIQYERAVSPRSSFAVGLRYMPKSDLPMKSTIKNLIDDAETWNNAQNLHTSNFSITPEYRRYFGKGVFRGFYLAPFLKFTNYHAELPFEFDVTNPITNETINEVIPLTGTVNTYTAGLLIGAQWQICRLISLDWWILGPNYGTSDGRVTGVRALNEYEQQYLRNELENLKVPLTKTRYTVDENGTRVDFNGGWGGIRAGLALGLRF